MITVFRKDELLESLGKSLEALRHPGPHSNMTDKEREWMEEGVMHVMDRLEGWCSPRQRIKSYEVKEKYLQSKGGQVPSANVQTAADKAIAKLGEILQSSNHEEAIKAASLILGYAQHQVENRQV